MREIVLDTETTGFEPAEGHRIVEIGAIELFNHMPTGRSYHQYINPERSMPKEAFEVHGLGDDFLRDKPKFAEIAAAFAEFIGTDSRLVIHNAAFDMKFLNAELGWVNLSPSTPSRSPAASFPALPPRSTRFAGASGSTTRRGKSMARCSTASCWPRSISN